MGKELKRMNYFDGLLLKAEDYKLDKEYQRRLQGFHNRYLHTWGIVSGLEVKPVTNSNMEVFVTEGVALDLTDEGQYGSDVEESISRQILIYDGHPDNPLDLSEYQAGDNIYITVSYAELKADRDIEKGQGEETHLWELGCISHSKTKPESNKKNILLARVVPRVVRERMDNGDGTSAENDETVVDSTCIFDTDLDGTPLRVYAGPYARVLGVKGFTFKSGENIAAMPFLTDFYEVAKGENQLEFNSASTKFTGVVEIMNDLVVRGELVSKKDGVVEKEFETEVQFLQVNSYYENSTDKVPWKCQDGGLEVFRGGPGVAPDARIVWSEADQHWKAGLGNELSAIVYGADWKKLNNGKPDNPDFADSCHAHAHGRLSSQKGTALSVDPAGNLSANGDLSVTDKALWFGPGGTNGGLAWYGDNKPFADLQVDGPVLAGISGGLLGTTSNGQKAVLSWNKTGNAGIGSVNPEDRLDVSGSLRLLSGSNPVRFTSSWTAFPDRTTNQAEICNDSTYHKALMIVGNQSAGQGRKVAIWDRLDVNGLLYVNGSAQVSQALTLSAGRGNNGIIFPSDPGGGLWDSAWMKYYPRSGESCTLEIGTSNDGDDNISLMPSGNTGIATLPENPKILKREPKDKLDVEGWMRILSGTNPIRFTSVWSGFPDQASNQAEICNYTTNDRTNDGTLMIVGNRSGGQGRKVAVWDRLEVNGPLKVTGNIQVKGAIIPGVGNCEVKGIMFPKDPHGGSGDAAWIRYYSDTSRGGGENMTLEIGISNDTNQERIIQSYWVSTCPWKVPNGCGYWATIDRIVYGNQGDRLRLYASGGTYIEGNLYYSSSREYKENIGDLCRTTARNVLEVLEPVEFNFKGDYGKTNMGFIAEDVPEIVAASDGKAVSPMEIIAVLVSEVKEQEKLLGKLKKKVAAIKGTGR